MKMVSTQFPVLFLTPWESESQRLCESLENTELYQDSTKCSSEMGAKGHSVLWCSLHPNQEAHRTSIVGMDTGIS